MAGLEAVSAWYGPGDWMGHVFALGPVEMLIMMFPLLLLVGIIVLVAVLVSRNRPPTASTTAPTPTSDARSILDARYARGEIDTAEYEERRRALG